MWQTYIVNKKAILQSNVKSTNLYRWTKILSDTEKLILKVFFNVNWKYRFSLRTVFRIEENRWNGSSLPGTGAFTLFWVSHLLYPPAILQKDKLGPPLATSSSWRWLGQQGSSGSGERGWPSHGPGSPWFSPRGRSLMLCQTSFSVHFPWLPFSRSEISNKIKPMNLTNYLEIFDSGWASHHWMNKNSHHAMH